MVKIVIRLDLSGYTHTELFNLMSMGILSTAEVRAELGERGYEDKDILLMCRKAIGE